MIKLRASALYISIIVSLIIAVITSSLITVAYFYRQELVMHQRYKQLSGNLESAIAILLSGDYRNPGSEEIVDLYDEQRDSIIIFKESWGIYEMGFAKSFTQSDTLKKAFLVGIDTREGLEALYLTDEERPLSLSGTSVITGDAFLPQAGVRSAFVEGKPYAGKGLVNGSVKVSKKALPPFNDQLVTAINSLLTFKTASKFHPMVTEVVNSFYNRTKIYYVGSSLDNNSARGRIILMSDTIVTISKNTILQDVILVAPAFIIEDGFKGSCQIFARDSIVAGKGVVFDYPSTLGIIKPGNGKIQNKISLGQDSRFNGIIFTYENKRSDLQTLISLGKNTKVEGEIFSSGFVKLEKPVQIRGKVSANRIIIQTPQALYENYLIDIDLNRMSRSEYYLSSKLFNARSPKDNILKWLN